MQPDASAKRRLFGVFLLGCVLFNFPILSLFNLDRSVFGIPMLYIYLFAVWAVVIGLIGLAQRSVRPSGPRR